MKAWTTQQVETTKAEIKTALDQHRQDPSKRLKLCLEMIKGLESAKQSAQVLKRLVLIISALYHHRLFGGLSARDVEKLSKIAQTIFKVVGIVPGKSRVAFLYGDFYNVQSQIQAKDGRHWDSIFSLKLAEYLSGSQSKLPKSHQLLAAGIRHSPRPGRLGFHRGRGRQHICHHIPGHSWRHCLRQRP